MRGRNFNKLFSIIGLVLGEIYMLLTILAPYHKGPAVPLKFALPIESALPADLSMPVGVLVFKLVVFAVLFGVFGALVGLGVGLLLTGLFAKRPPPAR
jgi:hypothetical protein